MIWEARMTQRAHFLAAILLAGAALAVSAVAARADRFHGGHFGGGVFYGPRFAVGPYYPYDAPPPVYAAPYPAPCPAPYPAPYPAPAYANPPAAMAQPAQYAIYFEFDRDQLTQEARAAVQRAAAAYRAGGQPHVQLIGHTDRAGAPSYNVALSQRRAETVRDALIRSGIPTGALSIAWRGENDPAVTTPDGAREPRNRRVLIVVGSGPVS
jgi:OOP family OmpA-OmpF porin